MADAALAAEEIRGHLVGVGGFGFGRARGLDGFCVTGFAGAAAGVVAGGALAATACGDGWLGPGVQPLSRRAVAAAPPVTTAARPTIQPRESFSSGSAGGSSATGGAGGGG